MRTHADILAAYQGWTGYVLATSVYPDQEEVLWMKLQSLPSPKEDVIGLPQNSNGYL